MLGKSFNTPTNSDWRPFVDPYGTALMSAGHWTDHPLIDIRKGLDGSIETVEPKQLHPMWNCYGWYWRPSLFTSRGRTIDGTAVQATP